MISLISFILLVETLPTQSISSFDYKSILYVIIGSFIGSTISYFYTRVRFQKEQLFLNKIESYKSLSGLLIHFADLQLLKTDVSELVKVWTKLNHELNLAYLFLPHSLMLEIRAMIATTNSKLGSYLGYINEQKEKTTYFKFNANNMTSPEEIEWIPSDFLVGLEIFSEFIYNKEYTLEYLKNDIENNWYKNLINKIKYYRYKNKKK